MKRTEGHSTRGTEFTWINMNSCELEKGFGLDGSPKPPLKKTEFIWICGPWPVHMTSHEFNGPLFGPMNSCELRSKISSEFTWVHMNSPKKRKKRARYERPWSLQILYCRLITAFIFCRIVIPQRCSFLKRSACNWEAVIRNFFSDQKFSRWLHFFQAKIFSVWKGLLQVRYRSLGRSLHHFFNSV